MRQTTRPGAHFAQAIHAENADIGWLVHVSRLIGETASASWMPLKRGCPLRMDHPKLPDVLEWHGIGLAPVRQSGAG